MIYIEEDQQNFFFIILIFITKIIFIMFLFAFWKNVNGFNLFAFFKSNEIELYNLEIELYIKKLPKNLSNPIDNKSIIRLNYNQTIHNQCLKVIKDHAEKKEHNAEKKEHNFDDEEKMDNFNFNFSWKDEINQELKNFLYGANPKKEESISTKKSIFTKKTEENIWTKENMTKEEIENMNEHEIAKKKKLFENRIISVLYLTSLFKYYVKTTEFKTNIPEIINNIIYRKAEIFNDTETKKNDNEIFNKSDLLDLQDSYNQLMNDVEYMIIEFISVVNPYDTFSRLLLCFIYQKFLNDKSLCVILHAESFGVDQNTVHS